MSKGSWKRPRQISAEEEDLRWDYADGKITLKQFNVRLNKIRRNKKVKNKAERK